MPSSKGHIISWIIFVIFLFGLFFLLLFSQKKISHQPISEPNEEQTQTRLKPKGFAEAEKTTQEKEALDLEAFNDSILHGAGCDRIAYDPDLKARCIENFRYHDAISQNNTSICMEIIDENLKGQCLDQVFFGSSLTSSDLEVCKKIKSADLQRRCLDQVYLASLKCDSIEDTALKNHCLDELSYHQAAASLKKDNCHMIRNNQQKEDCLTQIKNIQEIQKHASEINQSLSQSAHPPSSACETAECRDDLNFDLAFQQKDLNFCMKINYPEKKKKCLEINQISLDQYYLRQAVQQVDQVFCDRLLSPELKKICLQNFAL